MIARPILLLLALMPLLARGQRVREPELSLKGDLTLPVPLSPRLFDDITENIGRVGLRLQYPFAKGLGAGVGGDATWFGIEERSLLPYAVSGEIFRACYFGQVQYEHYTGERAFYELAAEAGLADYRYRSSLADPVPRSTGFHWGVHMGYYLHASEQLAFCLRLGYGTDDVYLTPDRLGVTEFPGRIVDGPQGPYRFLTIGLGFSTGFGRSRGTEVDW
ncbi:MAG: hypothetical protein H6597_05035 [Flavobacteriales bacterium]|nr:hypothetical protein [Flavobacteriales bacterium]MCB9193878.1 hypothetical protein [Flavobacteriales bacterium]